MFNIELVQIEKIKKETARLIFPPFSFFLVFMQIHPKKCMICSAVKLIKILIICKIMQKSLIISFSTIKIVGVIAIECMYGFFKGPLKKRRGRIAEWRCQLVVIELILTGNRKHQQWEECVQSAEWSLILPGIFSALRSTVMMCPIDEQKKKRKKRAENYKMTMQFVKKLQFLVRKCGKSQRNIRSDNSGQRSVKWSRPEMVGSRAITTTAVYCIRVEHHQTCWLRLVCEY